MFIFNEFCHFVSLEKFGFDLFFCEPARIDCFIVFFSSLLVRSPRIEISITKTWRNRHLKLNDVKKTSNLVCFSASFRVFSFWHFTCYSLCSLFVLAANELNCLIVFITMYRNSFGIACNYSNARSDFAQNNTKKIHIHVFYVVKTYGQNTWEAHTFHIDRFEESRWLYWWNSAMKLKIQGHVIWLKE